MRPIWNIMTEDLTTIRTNVIICAFLNVRNKAD